MQIIDTKELCKLYGRSLMLYIVKSQKFNDKFIIFGDLHKMSDIIVEYLDENNYFTDRIVICTGGLGSGSTKYSNGDPIEIYKKILDKCRELYFVQGDHDVHNQEIDLLINKNGNPCCLDKKIVCTTLGTIGGINGVIKKNNNPNLYKFTESEYIKSCNALLEDKPDIFVTHEIPKTYMFYPKLHIYSHLHHKLHYYKNYTEYINPNGRIIVIN